MLRLQAVEPCLLVGAPQLSLGLFGQRYEIRQMQVAPAIFVPAFS